MSRTFLKQAIESGMRVVKSHEQSCQSIPHIRISQWIQFPANFRKQGLALYRNYLIERLQLPCPVVDEEEGEDDGEFDDEFEEDEEFAGTAESPYRFVALAKPLQRRIADKLDSISGINGIFESDTDTMTAPLLFVSVAEDSPNYQPIN